MWTQEHLFEIHYDLAEIDQFTNIWLSSEIQNDREGSNEYFVGIRLGSSNRASLSAMGRPGRRHIGQDFRTVTATP
jgi:hypothetical protein